MSSPPFYLIVILKYMIDMESEELLNFSIMKRDKSTELFNLARGLLPGGVNSPVRAFKAVQGTPPFIERGQGARIFDVDGNEYIDYVLSWGPLILGHAHPQVIQALCETASRGTSFGAPTPLEIELARMIIEAVPSIEMVRMVNSGTEATMSAIRLARAYTGRNMIIKFEGCYHGHGDGLLVKAGSGATTLGVPDSPGVPHDYAKNTITLPFNDIARVKETMDRMGDEIACIIVEPIAGNMGVVPPMPGFLEALREITSSHGTLLIFDEVMTGFRVAYGGAQDLYGITPDLTCLGKIIGGGLPVGAYGGKREIMEYVAPAGPVYQAGTLSGNPVAMRAGIETLRILSAGNTYEYLARLSKRLVEGLKKAADESGISVYISSVNSMICLFFTDGPVVDYGSAKRSDTTLFSKFHAGMLEEGIYLPPSQFEAFFLSTAHTETDIDRTIEAAARTFRKLSQR